MNDAEKKQVAYAMGKIAQMAASTTAMINMIYEDEADIHRNAQIMSAIEALTEQTGIIADQWAGNLGGDHVKGGVDAWSMPPPFHSAA